MSQFEYDIEYRPILKHSNVDALSRLPDKKLRKEEEDAREVNLIATENIEILPVTHKKVRIATARDKVLSKVLALIHNNWPSLIGKKEVELQSYFKKREELTVYPVYQGVIMWGIGVVIPHALQQKLLTSLHETHAGIVKMNALARQFI